MHPAPCRCLTRTPPIGARPLQRGRALAEFLAIAVALVPLFLLMPLIAKYQDISHSTQMAARYIAFDSFARNDGASTWKSETELADEVRQRFFGNADAPIKTGDVAGDFLAHQNLFWRGPKGEPLIKNFNNDVKVSFGASNGAKHSDGLVSASDGITMPLHSELLLKASGVYTANVTVTLANMPAGLKFYEPFDKINLAVSRSTSVLFDPWMASDPGQVDERVGHSPAIFPAAKLVDVATAVGGYVSAVDWPGGITGPMLGSLSFYQDVVPQDRLRKSDGSSGGGSRRPAIPPLP